MILAGMVVLLIIAIAYKYIKQKLHSKSESNSENDEEKQDQPNLAIQSEESESFIIPQDSFTSSVEQSFDKQSELFTDPDTANPDDKPQQKKFLPEQVKQGEKSN